MSGRHRIEEQRKVAWPVALAVVFVIAMTIGSAYMIARSNVNSDPDASLGGVQQSVDPSETSVSPSPSSSPESTASRRRTTPSPSSSVTRPSRSAQPPNTRTSSTSLRRLTPGSWVSDQIEWGCRQGYIPASEC